MVSLKNSRFQKLGFAGEGCGDCDAGVGGGGAASGGEVGQHMAAAWERYLSDMRRRTECCDGLHRAHP